MYIHALRAEIAVTTILSYLTVSSAFKFKILRTIFFGSLSYLFIRNISREIDAVGRIINAIYLH